MKTITLNIGDEVYAALTRMAACVNTSVEEFAQMHLEVLINDAPTIQVMESRLNINRAVEKALSYEPGKTFNAKDIMPESLSQPQFLGYSRHIHTALQNNPNFTKVMDSPTAMVTYRRN